MSETSNEDKPVRNDLTGEGWSPEELSEWAKKHPWAREAAHRE